MAGPAYSAHDRARPRWLRALDPEVWKAGSIRAWATVPLRSGDMLVGALSIGLSVPHVWDAAERAWLEACAAAVTIGVENDHLFAAERQRTRMLEAELTAATGASGTHDPGA
jgi:GAF domain-containing protein